MGAPMTLDVDLTNPGQFLACCGLLELASRLDPESLAWFEGGSFRLTSTGESALIAGLLDCKAKPAPSADAAKPAEAEEDAEKSPPLYLGAPFDLRLDWWEDLSAVRAGFKTWSGGQTVLGFFDGMRAHVKNGDVARQSLLRYAIPVRKPKPFYFDSRLSRLTALDMGFSAEKFAATFSPAVEVLALIGLQRFRPRTVEPRESYSFCTWGEALPISISAAVAHGLVPSLIQHRYQFPLVVRTGGKYKAFGPSFLAKEPTCLTF